MRSFCQKFLFLVLGCTVVACNHVSKYQQQQEVLSRIIGKEVHFSNLIPLNVPLYMKLDSLLTRTKHKVVIYVDSSNCEDCRISKALAVRGYELELKRKQKEIPFIYIFNTQDIVLLKNYLDRLGFRHYYFVETDNTFLSDNGISSDARFHTFLLEDSKIKVIGNPSENLKIKDLYNRVLRTSK